MLAIPAPEVISAGSRLRGIVTLLTCLCTLIGPISGRRGYTQLVDEERELINDSLPKSATFGLKIFHPAPEKHLGKESPNDPNNHLRLLYRTEPLGAVSPIDPPPEPGPRMLTRTRNNRIITSHCTPPHSSSPSLHCPEPTARPLTR